MLFYGKGRERDIYLKAVLEIPPDKLMLNHANGLTQKSRTELKCF